MRFSARTWSLLSLLLFVAAAFFWLKGNEHEARKRLAPPVVASTNARATSVDLLSTRSATAQLASLSPGVTGKSSPRPITEDIIHNGEADPNEVEKRFPHRLRNTRKPLRELVRDDNAVLLANALIDTTGEPPQVPEHLTAPADPGSYVVQWNGPVDDRFRARLAEAGAEIISYVPNNAFYVKIDQAGADRLSGTPGVQSVLPFQPYYKLDGVLLAMAVKQEALPDDAILRLTFLPGTADAAQQVTGLAVNVVAEESSPFGPQLLVQPDPNSLVPLARLASVQAIERTGRRVPASDLSRVILGVAADGSTNENYLGLNGQGVLVNINDTGIQPSHPALTDTTIHLPAPPLQQLITAGNDPDGHGTFVASLIAGNGAQTPPTLETNTVVTDDSTNTVVNSNLPGSSTNASLRGLAPEVDLLALPLDPTGSYADVTLRLLDTWLIESAAATNYVTLRRTNSLISNNSWTYGQNFQTYDTSAARFDQAVRDALPGMTNHQPLLFVFAAGNRGFGEDDGFGGTFDSIESPGTAKNVITVGALETPRFITNAFYTITNYFYTTNADNTVTTNEVPENIYPFADATDSQDEVASFSSRGNVGIGVEGDQGRFKPDVVAPGTMILAARSAGWDFNGFNTNDTNFGQMYYNLHTNIQPYRFESGSTIAAANVSGVLALIQEYFQSTAPSGTRSTLSPALMKALLINGARSLSRNYDIAAKSAANYQGWGMPTLPNSLSSYTTNQHSSVPERKWRLRHVEQSAANALATGQSRTWNVTLNSNAVSFPLRATLVWTDPPGNPLVAVKLVNDLDLVVTNLDTGFVYYGNNIPLGGDATLPIDPSDPNSIADTDVINNVEQVTVANPALLGQRFSVTVRAQRVNVNTVPDYLAVSSPRNVNDIVQDFALVISSEMGADPALNDPDPQNPNGYIPNLDVFDEFTRVAQVGIEPRAGLTKITNGLPLFDQRVGANPTLIGTNGTIAQWNFYVFTNINDTNPMVTTRAGSNVAFVTFNPPNLSRTRAIEADIDLYVSKDPQLTNLNPAAVAASFKSLERGGTETIVFTNGVIGDIYYIGVKAEDQEAAEFSLIGVSSDRPFEEERNGRIYLYGVPIEAGIPDGNNRRPQAGTMLAIGLSNRRVAHAQVTTTTFHENYPDLVGVLTKQQTRVFLNNHNNGRTNFGTNTFIYEDNEMFANPPVTVPTDGPGSLNDLVGHKLVGAWFLEMIDSAPGQTGRVQRFEIAIDPLRDDLRIGATITGNVDPGEMAFYVLDVPPGATNINFLFTAVSGPLEFYWREEALPTTNQFDFRRDITPPGANFSLPVQPNRSYYIGLRNPGVSVVTFTLLLTAQYADADFNHFLDDRILNDVYDVATTNSVIDVGADKLVSDLRVGVQMKHPRTADIALTLISPQGSRILLAENRGYTNGAGFGSSSIVTNRAPDGTTYITNQAEYVIFTDDTNLARIPVKFANPGTTNSLGSVGVSFASSFELSVLPGNYFSGTTLAGGWEVSAGDQISVINGPGLAHTGDTLISLGTAGLTRQVPVSTGRSYKLRFAARKAPVMDFFSTGLDGSGSPIAPGTVDQHYRVFPGPLLAYVLETNEPPFFPPFSWSTNDSASQWLSPYPRVPATNTAGQFFYRTYINLYEHAAPTAYQRRFRWSGDDSARTVRLNGRTLDFPSAPSSNFFGSTTYSLSGFRNGLNIVDFSVNNSSDATGLRIEVLPAPPLVKVAAPEMTVNIGGLMRTVVLGDNWTETEITFVPGSSSEVLTLQSRTGEVWVDSIIVESTGGTFLQPEEPFELLEGERAMGEWRLEVRDTRTGAVLPTSDFLQWSLEVHFADTQNPALRMQPGDTSGPITIGSEEVQWVVLDPCQGATFARLILRGVGNFDELALFADLSGFPTGLPENDDFFPITNSENPGQANGIATFEINALMPAPARMTGKPIFIGIINQFVGVTNQFELEYISDGNCSITGPPPILTPDNPATGTLEPNSAGSGSTNNAGVFQFTVPPGVRAATISVVSDGDVTVYGQKDSIPTTSTFQYRVDAVDGPGTESMRIDQTSSPALTPGTYYIRIANDSAEGVTFTVTLSFESDTGPEPLEVAIIRTSDGSLQLQYFPTEAGVTYIIEGSNELGPTANWTTVATRVAGGVFETYPITVDQLLKHRFFRVRRP